MAPCSALKEHGIIALHYLQYWNIYYIVIMFITLLYEYIRNINK
jgi:hypothetical protein